MKSSRGLSCSDRNFDFTQSNVVACAHGRLHRTNNELFLCIKLRLIRACVSMASHQKCLVVGATGYIGLPLTLALASEGLQVFALVRPSSRQKNAESLQTLQNAGVQLQDGDIGDLQSLHSAFAVLAPVDIVVSAVAGPRVLQQTNLVQTALEAGTVKRFVPSEFSIDIPRARAKLPFLTEPRAQIMKEIQHVSLPYTVITSNSFMEDWFAGEQSHTCRKLIVAYCPSVANGCMMCSAISLLTLATTLCYIGSVAWICSANRSLVVLLLLLIVQPTSGSKINVSQGGGSCKQANCRAIKQPVTMPCRAV